MNSKQFVAMV